MPLLRIKDATVKGGRTLCLKLTGGTEIERDISPLLVGPIFDAVREDAALFQKIRVEAGTLMWPNGADLDPDMVIWGGPPARNASARPAKKLSLARAGHR